MSNRLSVLLILLIAGGITLDALRFDWQHSIFLAQRLWWFIDWIAFWR